MQFLHDVWVNWFEGVKHGYEVCFYHEWRKSDYLMVYERVPIVKVRKDFYNYVENTLEELPFGLLKEYKNMAAVRYNNEKEFLDFCVIFSDGERVIAADTCGYNFPIRKSRLTPFQESRVLEKLEYEETLGYEPLYSLGLESNEEEVLMRGLTRKERELKKILLTALEKLVSSNNIAELRYWYLEWFSNDYLEVKKLDAEMISEKLLSCTKSGWSDKHFRFAEKIVKSNTDLEQLWTLEVGSADKVS